MANLGEIVENRRTRESGDLVNEEEKDLTRGKSTKRRSRKRRNSRESQNSFETSPHSRVPEEERKPTQHADGPGQDKLPTQEDHKAKFYEDYHNVAKEYDEGFVRSRKEDLNAIFTSAGLFSAVTLVFINACSSLLQPDPADETNTLLRILIYKLDNTTFGGDIPSLGGWTGPLPSISTAQLILFLSLALTLLCASMSVLCKLWLDRYAWSDMEGSIVECGRNRQRKLEDIHAWYFLFIMDSLQLTLLASFFLFGSGVLMSLYGSGTPGASFIGAIILAGAPISVFAIFSGAVAHRPYQPPTPIHSIRDLLQGVVYPKTALDLRSISWILRASLNEAARLSAFKYLMSIPELPDFDPTLVARCFRIFTGCITLSNDKVVVRQGSEQLATLSISCFFRTFHHLSVADPNSSVLKEFRKFYNTIFPLDIGFRGLPFHHTMTMIHILVKQRLSPEPAEWDNEGLSTQELIPLAWYMSKAAQVGYQETRPRKVPRWILRFSLGFLSLDPPPPPSVVAHCLGITAIDLDCDISNITIKNESLRVEQISRLITRKLEAISPNQITSKRKAISALFPFAISQERSGNQGMADQILRAMATLYSRRLAWHCMEAILFAKSSSPFLITFVSPYLPWTATFYDKNTVNQWAAATLAVEYTEEEVGQRVVDVLLQIASDDSLRSHIPDHAWELLKKRVSLPPECLGRSLGIGLDVVHHIRERGDIEILKSYYLLVWSEWDSITEPAINEMETSIKEDFCGIGMEGHRKDLIARLDYVLARLNGGLESLGQERPGIDGNVIEQAKEQYRKLRNVLSMIEVGIRECGG